MKLVFTDLDATLLDHFTYSYKDSLEGIELLNKHNIPLIMVSSKTFAEMKNISEELNLHQPFIFENGGGVALPEGSEFKIKILGMHVDELENKMKKISKLISSNIKTFTEMTVEEVQELTGLASQKALLAKKRLASLPFIINQKKQLSGSELVEINKKISDEGIAITRGGRFYHFIADTTSKGNAVNYLKKYLQPQNKDAQKAVTMGVGDSLNDIPLLEVVDYPFAVRRHDNSHLKADFNIYITENIGPLGFSEAVKVFLKKVGLYEFK